MGKPSLAQPMQGVLFVLKTGSTQQERRRGMVVIDTRRLDVCVAFV